MTTDPSRLNPPEFTEPADGSSPGADLADSEASCESADPKGTVKRGQLRRTNRQGTETKELICEAAKTILREEGGEHLTFDRIARVADMSKGTLMYHYGSKNALMEELMERYRDRLAKRLSLGMIEAEMIESKVKDPMVAGFFEWYRTFHEEDASNTAYGLSILALSVKNDRMLKVLQDWYEELFDGLRDSKAGVDGLIAVLALEGLFFLRHFRMDMIGDEEVRAALAVMERRCAGEDVPSALPIREAAQDAAEVVAEQATSVPAPEREA